MGEKADSRRPASRSSPGGMPAGDTLLGGPPHVGPPPDDLPEIAMRPAWVSRDRIGAYQELEHPADLLLQITGPDLAALFENALFAFYDQVAELGGFRADREVVITVWGASPSDGLRELLNEALFRFETERFVAVGARVTIESPRSLKARSLRRERAGPSLGPAGSPRSRACGGRTRPETDTPSAPRSKQSHTTDWLSSERPTGPTGPQCCSMSKEVGDNAWERLHCDS